MKNIPSIKSDIERLKIIARNVNDEPVLASLNELSGKLVYNQFYLVIVGLFKRGKSSIINSLIGRELAPVAVTPLTSVITFFQYGSVTAAEVYFKNGNHVPIDLHDIFLFISEENNPKNTKNVEYVKISTKAEILENIILVDTPGLGSVFSHNTNTTIEFLPRIDAALFVLSADVPISKADEEFLKKIKDLIPDVLFVLNKSDLLTRDELDKMISYNVQMLKEIYKDETSNIELIPVSARDFFRSAGRAEGQDAGNIGYLRTRINQKIVRSKDEILLSRSIKMLLSYADQLQNLLKVKSDTLQLPVEELKKKRESMQRSIDFVASGKVDFDAVVKSRVKQLIDKITDQTEQKRRELSHYYYDLLIEKKVQTWAELKKTDADDYFRKIASDILQEFDELKTNLEESVREEFGNILLQYSTLSRSFLSEIITQMKEILGINIEGIISSFDMDVYTSFYFKTDTKYSIPSIRTNMLLKILPDKIVRSIVLKQIYTNCLELINPNSGRIRGDIDYKISESYRKFRYHFDQKLHDLLQSLKNMIEESIRTKSSMHENLGTILKSLRSEQETISKIIEQYSLHEKNSDIIKLNLKATRCQNPIILWRQMITDKQTLKDLEVFRSDENATTLFDFIDKTKTAGGSYCLRQKFINPPATFDELEKEQEAIRFFSEQAVSSSLTLPFTNRQMKSLEEYLGSNINVIENESLLTCIIFCFADIESYRYIKGSLKEIIDFVYTFFETIRDKKDGTPHLLRRIHDELASLINDPDFIKAAGTKNNKIRFWSILRSDRIFRTRLKKAFQEILERYYEVDALISMAITTAEQNFSFPDMINDNDPVFEVAGLYHPLLPNAVPYDINIAGISNFVFLTGPNMAGKTTFLKASGIAVYLAHLGMGIPARSARISYFDRLLTSLNITDSIASGYSFFYSEVKRVKQLAEHLKDGERIFSIFDELFRGTNVKDAFDASKMIISGLVRWNTSIFILSSHLWELWENIKNYNNIRELCFESKILDGRPFFSYRLFQGVSDMRLGLTIIENEKIMDLLNSTENVKD